MGTVSVRWIESKLMVGVDSFGHPLVMGSWPEQSPEWAGLKPSDLLMLAASSCTMYDVVTILTKQHEPLEKLEVTCTGEQMSEPPYAFTTMHLQYTAYGPLSEAKLQRAIQLSEEKYCSVTNTLKAGVKITRSYTLVNDAETPAA